MTLKILSRTTVSLMNSDHLGPQVARTMQPSELLIGTQGYTFGLGFAVRQEPGIAAVPGLRASTCGAVMPVLISGSIPRRNSSGS